MVRLRLQRLGNKNRPFYRIVAADQRSPRDGRFIEILGTYNPANVREDIKLKEDRIKYWLGNGAQPSEKVESILKKNGLVTA
ncbi:MAG: 30S ribosomal protein S16 [Leptospiraceae bacterium]|nr:30S ribosomal protein S16 [Leptospiraceae bacterium]